MKNQWLLGIGIGIGIALCAGTLGTVQAQETDGSVTVAAPRLTIELPARHHHMDNAELREFRGQYELANGQILRLSGNGTVMFGEIDDQGQHRMIAANHNTFVALDRKLQVRIELAPNGDDGGEVLMATPVRVALTGEIEERVVRLATR
jgi:hypothetical protein